MNKYEAVLSPEMGKKVLTFTNYGTFQVDYLTPDGWQSHRQGMKGGKVVCWWELPEIPRELLVKSDEK